MLEAGRNISIGKHSNGYRPRSDGRGRVRGTGYSAATFCAGFASPRMKSVAFCASLAARKTARVSSFIARSQPSMYAPLCAKSGVRPRVAQSRQLPISAVYPDSQRNSYAGARRWSCFEMRGVSLLSPRFQTSKERPTFTLRQMGSAERLKSEEKGRITSETAHSCRWRTGQDAAVAARIAAFRCIREI